MITEEEFVKFISSFQEFDKATERLEIAISGKNRCYFIFETDWYEAVGRMLDIFLSSHFTEEGVDLINWWLFESTKKIIYIPETLFEPKKEKYIDSLKDLWDFLKSDTKTYFING